MAYVLGNTDEVVEFDRARKNAKKHPQDKFFGGNLVLE